GPVPSAAATAPYAAETSTASFIPSDFSPPMLVRTATFKLVPLGPALVKVDFDAYMSSIEHLQKTFTRSTDWPHAGISSADAMRDMEAEEARFKKRESFAYAVLTPDGRRERGCVYVYPGTVAGYDAVARLWVTKAEYDAGFDAELYDWVVQWIGKDWPFAKVAYPGRSIPWESWDAMVAAARKE
nr:twin-arginine translocation pathway signal protein [Sphingobium sp.]